MCMQICVGACSRTSLLLCDSWGIRARGGVGELFPRPPTPIPDPQGGRHVAAAMSHKAFHQREIEHLQEQNSRIVAQVEQVEQERDRAHEQIDACREKDADLQSQLQSVRDKIDRLGAKLQQDKSETVAKDEHVRVLGEQNNQMLTLLEQEENKSKGHLNSIQQMEAKNKKLQRIAEEFDGAKAELEAKVAEVKKKCADVVASLRGQRSINENLRANIQNTEAKTRVDIEALGQALQVVDQKNLEYLNRINKQEILPHSGGCFRGPP